MAYVNPLKAIQTQNQAIVKDQPVPSLDDVTKPTSSPSRHAVLEHYQAQMVHDLARLKAISEIPEKNEAKRGMVGAYLPFVKDYITSGRYYPNSIAVQVMIWLFDIGDIENALNTALVLISQKQAMPERFSSSMETFVCDYTYDWANKLLAAGLSASPYLDQVVENIDLHFWDLHPAVASKMYALLAKFKFHDADYAKVVALCGQAELVNPEGAGVKTLKAKALAKL